MTMVAWLVAWLLAGVTLLVGYLIGALVTRWRLAEDFTVAAKHIQEAEDLLEKTKIHLNQ